MPEILRILFAQRHQCRYIFLVAAVPPAIIGLWVPGDWGGFYLVLASICLLQGAYPTMVGWILVSLVYTCFSALCVLGLFLALFRELTDAEAPGPFDPANLLPYVALVAVSLAVAIAVVRHRPKPLSA